ncbi:MAG: CapA family protein [Clostridia bacterium]
MKYNDELGKMTLVATGDIFITRKLSPYDEPQYLKMWDILKSGDIRFTNFEMLVHEFVGYPVAQSGGTYTQVDKVVLDELKFAGFNLLSLANNHSLDYSFEAMLRTRELFDKHNLTHAGTGINLADARSPRYLDLNKGRVGFLASSSSFAPHARAGQSRPDAIGRPGLNPVRYETYYELDADHFEYIKKIDKNLKNDQVKKDRKKTGWGPKDDVNTCHIGDNKYVLGKKPGIHTKINESDRAGNLKWISDAKRQSDFVVYSMHSHEGNPTDSYQPADFHIPFAHECIDAGANVFVGHGAHYIRGIEIYNGRPIFYGLGNFVFQNETVRKLPHDVYEKTSLDFEDTPANYYDKRSDSDSKGFPADKKFWQSFMPKCYFENGQLVKMVIYPITLGYGKKRTVRGRPMLANDSEAVEILEKLKELSKQLGTNIEIKENVGYITL